MLKPILMVGALAVSTVAAIPAHAQPQGSYLESCGDVRVYGDRLQANCRRVDGGWQRTVLNLNNCGAGDISNFNGHLTCGGEGYGSSYGPYDRGRYNGPYDRGQSYDRGPYGSYGYWGR